MPFAALALAVTTVAGLATARVDAVAVPKSATAIRAGGDLSDDFWQTVPPTDAFVQREPEEGGVPSQRTEFRVAYDATTHLREGARVRHRGRQDRQLPDAPRRRLAVGLDPRPDRLVSRQAHRVRVRRQPGRRQVRSLLVQRQQQRRQLGRGVGRQGVARRQRLDRRLPHSVFAGALQPERVDPVRLRRVAADRPAEPDRHVAAARAQRQRLRLVVRRARRPVDGRLAEAARAGAVHRREPHAAAARGQPAAVLVGEGRRDRPRREVRGDARADADGDRQPRLRPGGGGSRRREPVGVRDLLQRAPAVLRRRVRQLQLRRRLLGRAVLAVLHAPRRPRAARHRQPAVGRHRPHRLSAAVDDSRRREADRPRRQVLGRRDVRGDAGGDGDRRGRRPALPAGGRADHELRDRAGAARVREPVVDRRDDDGDQPAAAGLAAVPAQQRLHRRRRRRRALQEVLQPHRLRRLEPRQRRPFGDRVDPGRQPPLLPAPGRRLVLGGSDAHVAQRRQRTDRDQQDRRPAPALHVAGRVQVARVRSQRRRLPAPRRRALAAELGPGPQRRAEQMVPQPQPELQRVHGVELGRRQAGQRVQRQRLARRSSTTGRPAAASTPTSSPPTTA